jgi:PA domain
MSRLSHPLARISSLLAAMALSLGLAANAHAAAQINIIVADGPGVGFNDPTPVIPVGGNPGTTLGDQRLNLFKYVAGIWAGKLTSTVPIQVLALFDALNCTATGGVLGAAGPISVWKDFPGAKQPNTWYNSALANKLAKTDLDPVPNPDGDDLDIVAFFNGNLGRPGCIEGSSFYLGYDNNAAPNQINLATVLLHELGHGLGFMTLTRGNTGRQFLGSPSIWDHSLYDNTQRKLWVNMTDAERAKSGTTPRNLVWRGTRVTDGAESVLVEGTPELLIDAPSAIKGAYMAGPAPGFGTQLDFAPLKGNIARVIDQANGSTGLACAPLDAINAQAVAGRIALVDRGTCAFVVKAANVQAAGAIAMIVADNVAGGPPPDLGGAAAGINIPAIRITNADGAAIKAAFGPVRNLSEGPPAWLYLNRDKRRGADTSHRVFVYTPSVFAGGSSVSHFDTSAKRNLLMEPFINADLTQMVNAPNDLTLELLTDTGW